MDSKPFIVQYKPKKGVVDIKPGIHGRFETEDEAVRASDECQAWFGDKAVVEIIDQSPQESALV